MGCDWLQLLHLLVYIVPARINRETLSHAPTRHHRQLFPPIPLIWTGAICAASGQRGGGKREQTAGRNGAACEEHDTRAKKEDGQSIL